MKIDDWLSNIEGISDFWQVIFMGSRDKSLHGVGSGENLKGINETYLQTVEGEWAPEGIVALFQALRKDGRWDQIKE